MSKYSAIINIKNDGSICMEDPHSPAFNCESFDDLGIRSSRISKGFYRVSGCNVSWPEGWRSTIHKDENGENTSWISLGVDDGGLIVRTFEPSDKSTPMDIVYMLTLRIDCEPAV